MKNPMTNTTKSQVNPNFQIPRKMKNKKFIGSGSIGILDLLGSIGIYWDLGFFKREGKMRNVF